jgi:hypothetical protein
MKTLTNFLIDENTRRDFQIWCIQNGTTVSDNLRSHIEDVLEGQERTPMPTRTIMKNASSNWLREEDDNEYERPQTQKTSNNDWLEGNSGNSWLEVRDWL